MARRWLFKEEPTHYSFADLVRDRRTVWDGIENALARKHLREVRKGDPILYYHTGEVRAVVAIARAASDAYPDPKRKDGKAVVVDVEPVKALDRPVPLSAIKAQPAFKDFPLVRISRLSVMPVSEAEWRRIEAMAR
ncbi:MAG: EVE domain-containing protein [Thermoanaerobaculia bacterium]